MHRIARTAKITEPTYHIASTVGVPNVASEVRGPRRVRRACPNREVPGSEAEVWTAGHTNRARSTLRFMSRTPCAGLPGGLRGYEGRSETASTFVDLSASAGVPAVIQRRVWRFIVLAAGVLSAAAVRQLAVASWHALRRDEPPVHPSQRHVRLRDALTWAVSIAVGAAVAKVLAERVAAAGWEKATGAAPPDPSG